MSPHWLRSATFLACAIVVACAPAARTTQGHGDVVQRAPYDVVITNGKIVDGSGNPWTYADVAMRGDRIARITPAGALHDARAAARVDATGMVVAPGFIDIQAQSYEALLTGDGRSLSKVTQGVTTEILGEGSTPAPMNDVMLATLPTRIRRPACAGGLQRARGFGTWLDAMQTHANSVNVGSFLGAATVREYAKARAQGAPTPAQLDTMRRVVRDAMRDGALASPAR